MFTDLKEVHRPVKEMLIILFVQNRDEYKRQKEQEGEVSVCVGGWGVGVGGLERRIGAS